MPRSVTHPVISAAGVTSKPGLNVATVPEPGQPEAVRTSVAGLCSISIDAPVGRAGSTDVQGATT